MLCRGAFGGFSGNLLREIIGKDSLRFVTEGTTGSEFELARMVSAIPGRALPADRGRSGNFVLRFGGTSLGKSGRLIGRTGALGRGFGELGRDEDTEFAGARGRGFGELGREEDAEFTGARGRGLGELGREEDVECGTRPLLAGKRPTDGDRPTVEAGVVVRAMG